MFTEFHMTNMLPEEKNGMRIRISDVGHLKICLRQKAGATNKIKINCPDDLTERHLFENQKNTKDLLKIKRRIQLCLNFFVKKGLRKLSEKPLRCNW